MQKFSFTFLCVFSLCTFSVGQAPPLAEAERKAGERMTVTIEDVEYAFRWCPPGKFMMGSSENEANRFDYERQQEVTLSHGFWMLETEVTQNMWEIVMRNNPSEFKGAKLPVESVSWNDCQEFIKKLNDMQVAPVGFKFSLPTEAQWEYACRAGTTTAYHFGDMPTRQDANFGVSGHGRTWNVGSYPANAWGLKDMHGNVWEWCSDWSGEYPSGAVDPTGADRGTSRVIRGGAWSDLARFARSAQRNNRIPAYRSTYIGLRLSLVLEDR